MKGLCPIVLLGCVVAVTQGRYLLVDVEEAEPGKCKPWSSTLQYDYQLVIQKKLDVIVQQKLFYIFSENDACSPGYHEIEGNVGLDSKPLADLENTTLDDCKDLCNNDLRCNSIIYRILEHEGVGLEFCWLFSETNPSSSSEEIEFLVCTKGTFYVYLNSTQLVFI